MTAAQQPIFGPFEEIFDGDDLTGRRKFLLVPPEEMEAINKHILDAANLATRQDNALHTARDGLAFIENMFPDSPAKEILYQVEQEVPGADEPAKPPGSVVHLVKRTMEATANYFSEQWKEAFTETVILSRHVEQLEGELAKSRAARGEKAAS
jgi:hypothetical protein